MKSILIGLAILASSTAHAQYKCTINGKTTYSDVPCAPNAKNVGELQDNLTSDQQIQRLQQSLKEQKQINSIDAKNDSYRRNYERQANDITSREAAQASAQESARQRRCASLDYDIKNNQRGVARYQDFGWQRSLTQQENELKRNRESYDRDCR